MGVCGFIITWVDHARPIFHHFDDGCFKSTFRSLTLFYFNFLSFSLLPSFIIFYFSSTPDEDHESKALVIVLYVSAPR